MCGRPIVPVQREVSAEQFDHAPAPFQAGSAHISNRGSKLCALGIVQIAQQVHCHPVVFARDFHTAHQADALPLGSRGRLGPSADRVVICEPHGRQTGLRGFFQQFARRLCAVGEARVGVQIDRHATQSTEAADTTGLATMLVA